MSATQTFNVRWFYAFGGAIVVVALLLPLARTPSLVEQPVGRAAPDIELLRLDEERSALGEEAMLRDKRPLFLPTPWNAVPEALPTGLVTQPGESFPQIEPKLTFAADHAPMSLSAPTSVPGKPAEVVAVGTVELPFLGFGRDDQAVPKPAARDAFIEISGLGTGAVELRASVSGLKLPAGADWDPLEFVVAVDSAGLVGMPAPVAVDVAGLVGMPGLARTATSDQVGPYFRDYLASELRVGERLAPGLYRIKVAP